jgi:DNA topoisomerase-1
MKKYNFIVVESPTKANTIQKFVGKDYIIKASNGHIIDLPKERLGVDIKKNFEPEYTIIPEKRKIVNELKKIAQNASCIYLSTDPDREGEAISWHLKNIFEKVNDKNKIFRVILHEITKKSVIEGLNNPTTINLNLVNAQQARRILDRLVGYKISPLLWKNVQQGLSAGRVQSVALRMIVEREEEIEKFVPEEYWEIVVKLKKFDKEIVFEAKLVKENEKKIRIATKEEAEKIISYCKEQEFIVQKFEKKEKKKYPSPPFTTSTMQQEASKKLGFSVSKTMLIAQQLYEGVNLPEGPTGLITYMRTDSVRVSKEAQDETRNYIIKTFGNDYLPQEPVIYESKKGAQEAHEAIRPTSIHNTPEKVSQFLTEDQSKLYNLIWRRFISSQMNPALYLVTSVDISAGKYTFHISSSNLVFDGFLKVYETEEEELEKKPIPELIENEKLKVIDFIPSQHFTEPPPRYTEATLVKTLEEKGIGRPSTYAPTIGILLERGYIRKENKKLIPTEIGRVVNNLLITNFPDIFDYEFTANMEEKLDEIEEGKKNWQEILKEFYNSFECSLKNAQLNMKNVKKDLIKRTGQKCEKCGMEMIIRNGRFGKFLACSGFPKCNNTKSLDIISIKCPLDGGEIIKRKSKKGKVFYGCKNYPKCNFILYNKPIEEPCPKCGNIMVENKKGKEIIITCTNKSCDYKEIITE